MWWRSQWSLGSAKEFSCTAFTYSGTMVVSYCQYCHSAGWGRSFIGAPATACLCFLPAQCPDNSTVYRYALCLPRSELSLLSLGLPFLSLFICFFPSVSLLSPFWSLSVSPLLSLLFYLSSYVLTSVCSFLSRSLHLSSYVFPISLSSISLLFFSPLSSPPVCPLNV